MCKKEEHKQERFHTAITNQDLGLVEELISLRTVPVVVSNGNVRMTVNAFISRCKYKNIYRISKLTSLSN